MSKAQRPRIPARVKATGKEIVNDVYSDKYFFIAVYTGIAMPEDEIMFVHTDDEGFGLKPGPTGAALFKGVECAERYCYQLGEQNPGLNFRKIQLKR